MVGATFPILRFGSARRSAADSIDDLARHLFLEGVAVVCGFFGTDVAAGREDVAVRGDFGGGG